MQLSYSLIKTFYQCKHRFYHQFVLGKRSSNMYTIIGEYVHSIIEKFLKDNNISYLAEANKVYNILKDDGQCYMTIYNEILQILNNDILYDIKSYIGDNFSSEYKYRIHTEDLRISAIADVLVKRDNGYEIIDFKTSKKRKGMDKDDPKSYRADLLQLYLYAYIISQIEGIDITTISLYMLRENVVITRDVKQENLEEAKNYVLQAHKDISLFYSQLADGSYDFKNEELCEFCKPYGFCKFDNGQIW